LEYKVLQGEHYNAKREAVDEGPDLVGGVPADHDQVHKAYGCVDQVEREHYHERQRETLVHAHEYVGDLTYYQARADHTDGEVRV